MHITLFIENENKRTRVALQSSTIIDALDELHINPVTIVASLNGTIVPETAYLHEGDTLELFSVVSGG